MPTAQPATPTGLEVAERLIGAAHRLKQFANAQLATSRTSVPRTRLLAAVQSRPRQRMGDLAARLDITGRTLTVMRASGTSESSASKQRTSRAICSSVRSSNAPGFTTMSLSTSLTP